MKWVSNVSPNHENRLSPCLVRPDPVKLRGKSFVWSARSSRTPLNRPISTYILVFSNFVPPPCSSDNFRPDLKWLVWTYAEHAKWWEQGQVFNICWTWPTTYFQHMGFYLSIFSITGGQLMFSISSDQHMLSLLGGLVGGHKFLHGLCRLTHMNGKLMHINCTLMCTNRTRIAR